MPSWRALGREPLVHFLIAGAALFAVDQWRGGGARVAPAPAAPAAAMADAGTGPERTIVVDGEVLAELTAGLSRRHGRPPSSAELEAEIERWIDQEVLYREASLRGLDRDDPIVRQRVAAKMGFVVAEGVVVPEPSQAELEAWFLQHRQLWISPERIDFTHVFVDGAGAAATTRAEALLAKLEAGARPETLGDRFSGGHRYRGRKLADLAQSFGDEFVVGLDQHPLGRWFLHRSRFGLHLVRVDRREAGREADFETARPDVRKHWIEAKRELAVGEAVRQLRRSWEIVRR